MFYFFVFIIVIILYYNVFLYLCRSNPCFMYTSKIREHAKPKNLSLGTIFWTAMRPCFIVKSNRLITVMSYIGVVSVVILVIDDKSTVIIMIVVNGCSTLFSMFVRDIDVFSLLYCCTSDNNMFFSLS